MNKDEKAGEKVVKEPMDAPSFRASIPEYLIKDMSGHDRYIMEQLSVMQQQNEWQTDMVHKIYNYTKTINGKVVDLEHFRQRMEMEIKLDEKWESREEKLNKIKKWGLILFLGLLYPLYLTIINNTGLGEVFKNLLKI